MATGGQTENGCSLIKVEGVTLQDSNEYPWFQGIVVISNKIFIIDGNYRKVRIHGLQDGRLLYESDRLESEPRAVCLINESEIAVILENGLIKIMSTHDTPGIRWARDLPVWGGLNEYHGVMSFKGDLVVCGVKKSTLCWCIVSSNDGHVVGTIHQICEGKFGSSCYITAKHNIIYISCDVGSPDSGVYAYDVHNRSKYIFSYKYKYSYKQTYLKRPAGIAIDQHGSLFVCNLNNPYPCIYHLTWECRLVSIIKQGIPFLPRAIFCDDGLVYVTSWNSNHITRYMTQYPDAGPVSVDGQSNTQGIMKKEQVDAEKEKRYRHEVCEKYFREIRSYLKDKPTRFHLVDEDFAIDNTVVDSNLVALKKKIVEVASQQPYWGEEVPARWILLERELMRLKAAGIKVIPRTLLEAFNQAEDVPISTEELDLFLKFQNDIGTILYFSIELLKDKIVLVPQWMIDAVKSLITAEMFVLRNAPAVSEKWDMFNKSGKLVPELIDAIWTQENYPDLHDNKEHILQLMEHLNIIARPRCFSEDGSEIKVDNYFLAPCMFKEKTPEDVMFPKPDPEMSSSSVLCYNFVDKFLPSAIFHRLLATCVSQWPIAKTKSENQIFCGCCIFSLDLHHRLTVLFREYVIFVQVFRFGTTEMTPSSKLCIEVQEFIRKTLTSIIGNLGQSLQFEMFVQCPKSVGYGVDCLIPLADLQGNVDVPCHFHDVHVIRSQDVLKFWFQEEDPSDVGSSAGAMPSPLISDTDRFMCIAYLLVDVGSKVLRQLLSHHTVTPTCTLDQYLVKNKSTIISLKRVFNQSQMDIMFPQNRVPTNLDDYDITLLSALFQNIVPTLSQQEKGMIKRLREERNKLYGHAKSCQISDNDFQTYWNDISSILTTLSQQCGDTAFEAIILQEIQRTKVSAIPAGSYLDILKTWFDMIESVKDELQNVTTRLQALDSNKKSPASES